MFISTGRQRKWKRSHNLNWCLNNVCKMPCVVSQNTWSSIRHSLQCQWRNSYGKQYVICVQTCPVAAVGAPSALPVESWATQSHASRPIDWHWNYGFSQPFFRGPSAARNCGTALQRRHPAIISPNTPNQLVISLRLVLMWGAWLQVWSWIQQRQFIVLSFRSVIYSFGGLLCLFTGSARTLSPRRKVQFFVICFSVHEYSFSYIQFGLKKRRGERRKLDIMRGNTW